MRRVQEVVAPSGFRHGDHLCWGHDGARGWRDTVGAFLLEGVGRGEQVLYTGSGTAEDLVGELTGLADRDELLAAGALQVLPGGGSPREDPERAARDLELVAAEAARAGYRGVRVVDDLTAAMAPGVDAVTVARSEMRCDRVVARAGMTALCGYDRGRVAPEAAALIELVHPLRAGRGPGDRCWFVAEGDHWRLDGELDTVQAARLARVMGTAPVDHVLEVELDRLTFVDTAGAAALTAVASAAPGGLVLHRPSSVLRRLLETLVRVAVPELRIDEAGDALHLTRAPGGPRR